MSTQQCLLLDGQQALDDHQHLHPKESERQLLAQPRLPPAVCTHSFGRAQQLTHLEVVKELRGAALAVAVHDLGWVDRLGW